MKYRLKNITRIVPKRHIIFWWGVRILLICCWIYAAFWLSCKDCTLYRADGATKASQAIAAFTVSFTWEVLYVLGGKYWLGNISYRTQSLLCLFLIFGCAIGSYLYLYEKFSFYDIIMHTFSGVITAICGYEILKALFHGKEYRISKPLLAVWCVMFVLSIACLWEIYEFSVDCLLGSNMQIRFERTADNWKINGGCVQFILGPVVEASGAVKSTLKKALVDMGENLLTSAQINSAVYDTMTDIISALIGGIVTTVVIVKRQNKVEENFSPQSE